MSRRIVWLIGIGFGVWFGLGWLCQCLADALWFNELGYLSVFWLRLTTRVGLAIGVTLLSAAFLLGNGAIARRLLYLARREAALQTPTAEQVQLFTAPYPAIEAPTPSPPALPLRWLLPLALGLSLLLSGLLLQYAQLAVRWGSLDPRQAELPPLPPLLGVGAIGQLGQELLSSTQPRSLVMGKLGLLLGLAIAVLLYPKLLDALAMGWAIGLGYLLAAQWGRILQLIQAVAFEQVDPLFSRDIGFYIFTLPGVELLAFWLAGLVGYAFTAIALRYLLANNSLSQGRFAGFSPLQKRHLCGLASGLMLVVGLLLWLDRYELLYSRQGVVYGASYTDIAARLPALTGLAGLAGALAVFFFWQAVVQPNRSRIGLFSNRSLLIGFGAIAIVLLNVVPEMVQRLVVQPNELAREQPYIERTIKFTRQAFALDAIAIESFNPVANLTAADLRANALTIRNIRLWDQRPLLETNRQLQQIRPYYRFADADIDRYALQPEGSAQRTIPAEKQQVLISARELDYSTVPAEAKTWVNEHLVYTHGYGFTLSPVNRVAPGGLPDYFVKDIGVETNAAGGVQASSQQIRNSIPIQHPRIYYGEITNTYVMTRTRVQELDYPTGDTNAYNTYDGSGGVQIGSVWRRLLFARYLRDWQMVFTNNFTPETKLLFRRTIAERIRTIAPFLRFDQDPYLVVVDTQPESQADHNHLYWLIDAYTTSDRYPYAEPTAQPFNYIRNSVKVVVDAYNGSVSFFVAAPTDPIIRTWQKVFPQLFQPLEAMPAALRSHIRYPADLFEIQSGQLTTYHMSDPQVFYNREDQWQIPLEIYGSEPRPVEPYYLITNLPTTGASEEFITIVPFKPSQRTNLTAWLAARSDGENYGKSLLYVFPKQQLVYGTEQIEARINQDPVISQQISLWNRQGSRALQGNLLVIPIEQSLLYVEPLYLEAEQNSLPTLVRVIVAYENRIVMAETLDQALQAIFQPRNQAAPVIRSVE